MPATALIGLDRPVPPRREALVRAALREEGAAFFAAMAGTADDSAERLRRVVPALAAWFRGGRFCGCAFMNAVAEHTKGEPWLRELAASTIGRSWRS